MRCLLISILLGSVVSAAEPDQVQTVARIEELAAKEVPVARVDTFLRLAVALEKTDAEQCGKYLGRATELLQRHPEIPATRATIVNLFALDPRNAEQILLARSDPAPARVGVIEYLLGHGQPVEAVALLDAQQLKPEELTSLIMPITGGLARLSGTDREQARKALQRILPLFDDPQFGLAGPRRFTAEFPGGVKTLTTRETLLFPIAALMRRIDPTGYQERASLFAKWAELLANGSVAVGRPLSRQIEYVNGQDSERAPDVEKVPLADVLAAVQGNLALAEGVTIRLVELKRNRDEILAAAKVYLKALEQGNHNPDSYAYIAGLVRTYSFPLGGENPSVQARLALSDLAALLNTKYDFTLPDLTGKRISLSGQQGKIVLLNFWATWCVPCRSEMPMLERIYRQYHDRGFVILAVTDDQAAVAQRFIAEQGYTFPVLIDSQHSVRDHYGVLGIPVTKILDRSGVIRATFSESRESDLIQALSSAGLAVDIHR